MVHQKTLRELKKRRVDFKERSFSALVLVQCSMAGVGMASLILCQWTQGADGTRDVFGGLYWPGDSFFEERRCKQLRSKMLMIGGGVYNGPSSPELVKKQHF